MGRYCSTSPVTVEGHTLDVCLPVCACYAILQVPVSESDLQYTPVFLNYYVYIRMCNNVMYLQPCTATDVTCSEAHCAEDTYKHTCVPNLCTHLLLPAGDE